MPINNRRGTYSASGFTMVEMAIVLVISGLITLIIFEALHYQAMQHQIQVTNENITAVETALDEYAGNNGRYPCPAPRTALQGSVAYGREAGAPGNCVSADVALAKGYDGTVNAVVIGAVPFNDIAPLIYNTTINAGQAIDGWGNRLTYAVTKSQTDKTKFRDDQGAVDVRDENDAPVISRPDLTNPGTSKAIGAHYVVVSQGADGRGAYSLAGTPVSNCGNSISTNPTPKNQANVRTELENCNDKGKFLFGLRSQSEFTFNDDVLKFTSVQRTDLWNTVGGPANINLAVNTNLGNVGIGVDPSTLALPQKLNVLGPLQASGIWANNFCDQGGINCLPASKIAGQDGIMSCPPGEVITSIHNPVSGIINPKTGQEDTSKIKVECSAIANTAPAAVSCAAGSYLVGISNVGNIKCYTPATQKVCINNNPNNCL